MNLFRSLQGKLLVPIALFLTVLFSFSRLYDLYLNYIDYERNLIERVTVFSKGVAFNLSAAMAFDDSLIANETLSAFSADPDVGLASLTYTDGRPFAYYESEHHVHRVEMHEHDSESLSGHIRDAHHIHVFVPVMSGQEVLGALHVIAGKSYIANLNAKAINKGLFELLMIIVMGYLLYKFIERQIVLPVSGSINQYKTTLRIVIRSIA
ncbi:GGDEF family protein [Vibrio astriarenae]|nr:GGDEF family protein [Vibrio sp. C7]